MGRIAVFDSGLGSLSIIKAIQRVSKNEIIYFADHKNFPYGKKSKKQLEKIVKNSIIVLEEQFQPDLIVVGSNTPTIMLDIFSTRVIGVNPPLGKASTLSKTNNIGILATESAIKSQELSNFIKECDLPTKTKVYKINGSQLVELVENGTFILDKEYSLKLIRRVLSRKILRNKIDVITLSSTHLPFLKSILNSEFPKVNFIDPAEMVGKIVLKKLKNKQSKRNSLKIYSSDKSGIVQKNLALMGIKNKINFLRV
ncbi:MAG: aspartate/glutamate racemase family protein [Nitrosopumilaceae archaeon]|nr:aspartate/glutamate racemase family protein [Nitrosopumilaceae archaeon]